MSQVLEQSSETLRPYAPRLLIRWLAEQPHRSFRTLDGSMVFVDISGFTKMSERLARHGKVGAEEVTEVLGAVFAKLLGVAYGEDGSLLKFGGDALLLWFSGSGHAQRAATSAHGMRATLRSVGRLDTTAGKVLLRMSVGVNTGSFHFFLVGESHRELIVTGPAASRTVEMESTATAGEILVSRDTAAALPARALGQPKGEGILLRSGPPTLSFGRDDAEVLITSIDVAQGVPVTLREHLLSGAAEPEHRTATVAFVHFDGVDGLIEQRGVDVTAAGLHELITCVQHAAEENGVTFLGTDIDHDGGKVILVAGAPNALGDDEGRMLLTLRSIIDAETTVPVRIGVNKGPVFAGDIGPGYRRTYTVMGDAVNLAARVMSMAVPGQILATGSVLDASSVAFNTVALEPFMVKGKKQPVHAFMVGHSTGSKPETISREFPLVGRDAEMDAIRRALLELRGGHGSVIELVGNAGMGKTRLLSEFRAEAPDLPNLVSGCEPYESSVAYLPIRRLLRLLLGAGQDVSGLARRLREDVAHRAPELLPWLPLLAIVADAEVPMTPEVQDLGEEFRKAKLEEVTTDYLARSVTDPTIVVTEDVHWMDEGSAGLLRAIAGRISELPWLVCVSRRDEETGFVLPEAPRCTSLRLTPLAEDALENLIDVATEDAPLPRHEVAEMSSRSGGNPLFLQELLHAAKSAGTVEGLPDSIEGMITAEIDRLPSRDRRILRYVSVLGMAFDANLAGALFDERDDVDGGVWRRLASFLEDQGAGRFRFQHALMRDVAYEGLPYRRRKQLHARVGNAILASTPEQAEVLSLHFFLAGDDRLAWRYSVIAARRAESAYANLEASRFFRRAIDAGRRLSEVTERDLSSLYEALGDVRERLGDYPGALAAYRAARRSMRDEPLLVAQLLLKEAVVTSRAGGYTQSLRWTSHGRRLLERLDEVEANKKRARLSAWYAHIRRRQGRRAEAIRWARLAIEEAEASGEREALASAYRTLDLSNVELGRYEDVTHYPLALAIYEELGDLMESGTINNDLGAFAYYQGRWDDALAFYEKARDQWERAGDLPWAATISANVAEILSDRGQLEEADQMGREALRILRGAGLKSAIAFGLNIVGRVACRSGRYVEALELLEQGRVVNHEIGDQPEELESDVRIAECLAMQGRSAQALELATEALVRSETLGGPATPQLQRVRGCALAQLGRLSEARVALQESVAGARDREAEYEEALALHGLARIAAMEERPDAPELEARYRAIFERLGVVAAPVIPIGEALEPPSPRG
ncbi:MAG TPA: adenylate/guanylate cyclase domain-containing protein [Actinomycetota bacterium]|nr:adenylate/guanylate cyclase domain-containing protein [Actinomycetota bacterium]